MEKDIRKATEKLAKSNKKFIKEFKEFISRGNVVDLAVGVVIGGAFSKIVSSLVNDIIMPLVGIIIGGINAIAQLGYLSFISYKVDAGDVELEINNTECAELQIILNTLLVQFQSIEESYPKYIQVQEV